MFCVSFNIRKPKSKPIIKRGSIRFIIFEPVQNSSLLFCIGHSTCSITSDYIFSVTSTSIALLDYGLYLHSLFSDVPLHKKYKSPNQEEIKFRNNICDYTFKKLY